jgi:hypothetical protein
MGAVWPTKEISESWADDLKGEDLAHAPSSSTYMIPCTLKLSRDGPRQRTRYTRITSVTSLKERNARGVRLDAPDRLPADGAHLVAETVRVPPVLLGGERVRPRILLALLVHDTVARSGQPKVDVQVPSACDLIRDSHLGAAKEVQEGCGTEQGDETSGAGAKRAGRGVSSVGG